MSHKHVSYMSTRHSLVLQKALDLDIAWHERRLGEW